MEMGKARMLLLLLLSFGPGSAQGAPLCGAASTHGMLQYDRTSDSASFCNPSSSVVTLQSLDTGTACIARGIAPGTIQYAAGGGSAAPCSAPYTSGTCTVSSPPSTPSGNFAGHCISGYGSGSCSFQCNSGSWTPGSNSCAPAPCIGPHTVGTCTVAATSTPSGTTAAGACDPGYSGTCSFACSNSSWGPPTNACVSACSGFFYNGFCYHMGANGKSCDTACSSHGGCDLTGTLLIGGSDPDCQVVSSTLAPVAWNGHAGSGYPTGLGCFNVPTSDSISGNFRDAVTTTTCAASFAWNGTRRFCACTN